jgi:hypothetical protein
VQNALIEADEPLYWSNGISTSKATLIEAQQDLKITAAWLAECDKATKDRVNTDKVICEVSSYKDIAENAHLNILTENEFKRLQG